MTQLPQSIPSHPSKLNEFDRAVALHEGGALCAFELNTMQINLGLRCNQHCRHCHVAAGPRRTEEMTWETIEAIIAAIRRTGCALADLTGGAPELHPHFRHFVTALREAGAAVQVRTNLTVLLEPGLESMPDFLAAQRVRLVASLPCYLEENVDSQRGPGAHAASIEALRRLNTLGYGLREDLPLDLVYNPLGPALPPGQQALEEDYRRELERRHGVRFTRLLTITNMPIGRYRGELRRRNQEAGYQALLRENFNPRTLPALMCRHAISVGWDGTLHDCDFNLALRLPVDHGASSRLRDFDPEALARRRIVTGDHCFGCTAGHGSSCGGALA